MWFSKIPVSKIRFPQVLVFDLPLGDCVDVLGWLGGAFAGLSMASGISGTACKCNIQLLFIYNTDSHLVAMKWLINIIYNIKLDKSDFF